MKVVKYPNNKLWVTKELKSIINKKKLTDFIRDTQEKKTAFRLNKKPIKLKLNTAIIMLIRQKTH